MWYPGFSTVLQWYRCGTMDALAALFQGVLEMPPAHLRDTVERDFNTNRSGARVQRPHGLLGELDEGIRVWWVSGVAVARTVQSSSRVVKTARVVVKGARLHDAVANSKREAHSTPADVLRGGGDHVWR